MTSFWLSSFLIFNWSLICSQSRTLKYLSLVNSKEWTFFDNCWFFKGNLKENWLRVFVMNFYFLHYRWSCEFWQGTKGIKLMSKTLLSGFLIEPLCCYSQLARSVYGSIMAQWQVLSVVAMQSWETRGTVHEAVQFLADW